MATGIGPWTLGKDLTSVTIAPVTVSGTTWTGGTPIECVTMVRRINHQMRFGLKDIRPVTEIQENMVPISIGHTLQLVNLRRSNNTTPGNPLSSIVTSNSYVLCIFADSHEQFSGYYAIAGYEGGFDSNEEQMQSVDLQPVAIVGGQVTRTFI